MSRSEYRILRPTEYRMSEPMSSPCAKTGTMRAERRLSRRLASELDASTGDEIVHEDAALASSGSGPGLWPGAEADAKPDEARGVGLGRRHRDQIAGLRLSSSRRQLEPLTALAGVRGDLLVRLVELEAL